MTLHVLVTGVSGTGKSTVGQRIADHLDVGLHEGDDLHPPHNTAKMSAGDPLTDQDRQPWLERLASIIAHEHARGRSSVLTCSALRRRYRDLLRSDLPPDAVFFVQLHADRAVLEDRMTGRDHFMPVSLLDSQLATLQPLQSDEAGVVVDVAQPLDEVVARILSALRPPYD